MTCWGNRSRRRSDDGFRFPIPAQRRAGGACLHDPARSHPRIRHRRFGMRRWGRILQFGFYTYFKPVSYNADSRSGDGRFRCPSWLRGRSADRARSRGRRGSGSRPIALPPCTCTARRTLLPSLTGRRSRGTRSETAAARPARSPRRLLPIAASVVSADDRMQGNKGPLGFHAELISSPHASAMLFLSMRVVGQIHGPAAFRSRTAFFVHHCFDGLPDPFCRRLDFTVSDMSVTHGHAHITVAEQAGDDW